MANQFLKGMVFGESPFTLLRNHYKKWLDFQKEALVCGGRGAQ